MIDITKKAVLGDISCVVVTSKFCDTHEVAFKLLKGRDGLHIFDSVLRPMIVGLSKLADGESFVEALQKTLTSLPYELLFDVIGAKVFAGAVIDNTSILTTKADYETYFGEYRIEFYALLAAGLMVNYEKDFSQLRKIVSGVFSERKVTAVETPI